MRPYKIVCISVYPEDLDRIDWIVARLKEAGVYKASRSAVIRYAVDHFDVNSLGPPGIFCQRWYIPEVPEPPRQTRRRRRNKHAKQKPPTNYSTISISLYNDYVETIDRLVEALKEAGYDPNRSSLIRYLIHCTGGTMRQNATFTDLPQINCI